MADRGDDELTSAPWWRGAALYQVYPLSFCDSNGDGWGDLAGVTRKLAHVASLGVDGIWLSPFYKSPMNDFGYDCVEYCEVDPRLGTMDDFDELVAHAHGLGLKVLIDQVYTYTSHMHPWFVDSRSSPDSPRRDWYVWADPRPDGTPPNNWQSIFGGPAWEWDPGSGQYFLTHFCPEMPHLDARLPEVQDALLDVARFWLARGVDGFRLDVINLATVDPLLRDNPPTAGTFGSPDEAQVHLYDRSWPDTTGFVGRLRSVLDEAPGRHLLAELTSLPTLDRNAALFEPGHLHTAYFVIGPHERALKPADVRSIVTETAASVCWPTWTFSNHDVIRGVTRCAAPGSDADPRFAELLMAILVCLRGSLLLYQGDELGLPHADTPQDRLRDRHSIRFHPRGMRRDGARTPVPWSTEVPAGNEPWLPFDPRHLRLSVEAQRVDPSSTLARTTVWLGWRRNAPAFRAAALTIVETPEPILAWTRNGLEHRWLCLFNLGAETERYALDVQARLDIASPGVCIRSGGVELAPFAAAVLQVDAASPDSEALRKKLM